MSWNSKQGFKIGRRYFAIPVFLTWGEPGIWTDRELAMIKVGHFKARLLHPRWYGGTTRTTTYCLEFRWKETVKQFSFTWRPDVTRYYWQRTSMLDSRITDSKINLERTGK